MTTDHYRKPAGCRQPCGGRRPPPPAEFVNLSHIRMPWECGISLHGACPVVKSIRRHLDKLQRNGVSPR